MSRIVSKTISRALFGRTLEARREAHRANSAPRHHSDLPDLGEIIGIAGMTTVPMIGLVAAISAKEVFSGATERAHSPQLALSIAAAELCVAGIVGVRSSRRARTY